MHGHYGRDPATGCKALFVYKPGEEASAKSRYYVWHKTPKRLSVGTPGAAGVKDRQTAIRTNWATGHSKEQRQNLWAAAGGKCQKCGVSGVELIVHHPNRMCNAQHDKKGFCHVAASGMAQKAILLCSACHLAYHHGNMSQ